MGYSETGIEVLNVEVMRRSGDVENLVKALRHRNRYVWETAVNALGEIGEPAMGDLRAAEPLKKALRDSEENVRITAGKALDRLIAGGLEVY
ncbi:MAG: HEAT repeat domain-containing protein [Actinomycetota bacterium]|nr:HEAT repeat domain-containing protein [Actinomycetota bacterium]